MPVKLTRAGTDYVSLTIADSDIDFPFTMAAWFLATNDTASNCIMAIGDVTNADCHLMAAGGNIAGDPIRLFSQKGASTDNVDSTTSYIKNKWHHACGIFASIAPRHEVWLDGRGYNSGGVQYDGTNNGIRIGRNASNTTSSHMDGKIAHAAIWNVRLLNWEVQYLAQGISPLKIRPSKLQYYLPLLTGYDEYKESVVWNKINNPVIVGEPGLIINRVGDPLLLTRDPRKKNPAGKPKKPPKPPPPSPPAPQTYEEALVLAKTNGLTETMSLIIEAALALAKELDLDVTVQGDWQVAMTLAAVRTLNIAVAGEWEAAVTFAYSYLYPDPNLDKSYETITRIQTTSNLRNSIRRQYVPDYHRQKIDGFEKKKKEEEDE